MATPVRARGPFADTTWAIVPNALFFATFFLLPFVALLVMSVYSDNPLYAPTASLTLDNFRRFFEDSYNLLVTWNTVRLGLWTTVITLLVGYPFAYWIVRTPSNALRILLVLVVMTPMLTGIVVRTYSWMTLLSDSGVINSVLMNLGIITTPVPLMYNELGIVIALVHIYMPFMVLSSSASWRRSISISSWPPRTWAPHPCGPSSKSRCRSAFLASLQDRSWSSQWASVPMSRRS